jgi:hypothetical protein
MVSMLIQYRSQPTGKYQLCNLGQPLDVVGNFHRTSAVVSRRVHSTHYDYKNFYQRGDDWLISRRWEQIIGLRSKLPMVEMITWCAYINFKPLGSSSDSGTFRNDFGESD